MTRKKQKTTEETGRSTPSPLEGIAASSDQKLRIKRSRRRVYDPVEPDTPPAVRQERTQADPTEENLRDKVRVAKGKDIVKNHVFAAMGAGLVPIPLLDMAAVSGVQVNMIYRLSALYGVPFVETKAKALIASLVGGIGPGVLAGGVFGAMVKTVPRIGTLIGSVKMPILSGAATYAVGMVFVQHFESGGTFLDLDPAKVKDHYASQFREGTGHLP